MKSNDIRSSFLEFFAERGHKVVSSSPLIPQDDPTLLFTNAGMNQFKNVFLGLEKRDYKKAASSQKCLRAGGKHNDLENVGFTARHHTFFEMLGNFSFGDYFKAEAIDFAWEWVTKTLGLDPKHLYATVFREDDDAERLWRKIAPQLGDRVLRFDEHDNFWSMGESGPCGPCSEIHYDRGPQYPGELNGDGDRFMEIWNLVFMQYNRDESKTLTPLPKPSVDTGAGLERFCMVLQNAESNYDTDLFMALLDKVAKLSGMEYFDDSRGISHRVISDHARALAFAIADGGIISNEGRGYVLRRILRRAARHGRLLGMHEPFLHKIVEPLVQVMGGHYQEIAAKRSHIELVVKSEEEQFGRTLDTGLEIFEDIIKKVESSGAKLIPGSEVFRLYDTYGFPVDLTEVMAKERGLHLDMVGFEEELKKQRERSRKESMFSGTSMVGGPIEVKRPSGMERFVGYDKNSIVTNIENIQVLADDIKLILQQTPFYAESGGQVGDTGKIFSDQFTIEINDTKKFNDEHIHIGRVLKGEIPERYSGRITAAINENNRADIKRNHTATHLLHKALRIVLGEHVHQAGSLVAPDRLRFDFTHFRAMAPEEIDKVEQIAIDKIREDLPVRWENKRLEEARKMGAMALFGEKYGEIVRVVTTGEPPNIFSMELCGGTHVDHTAEIGNFVITQETAIAAGMRRIEALTGSGAGQFLDEQYKIVAQIREYLKKDVDRLAEDDISKFRTLAGNAHRRVLQREHLTKQIDDYQAGIERELKRMQKDSRGKLAEKAGQIEPAANLDGGKLKLFRFDDTHDAKLYADIFSAMNPEAAVVALSGSNGQFAIKSQDYEYSKRIFDDMKEFGARGGGKPTISGSMPKDKITSFIEKVREKFNNV